VGRIDKETYYLNIAKEVSQRSTCLRAHAGAILIKNDAIIATGYSGAPRGEPNCCDVGICERDKLGIKPGKNYELCKSLHAELNCIINIARVGSNSTIGSKLYIYFERLDGQKLRHGKPCFMCQRAMKNAGIFEWVFKEVVNGETAITVGSL